VSKIAEAGKEARGPISSLLDATTRKEKAVRLRSEQVPKLILLAGVAVVGVIVLRELFDFWPVSKMPGESWRGDLPALTEREAAASGALRRDVEALAGRIGERNMFRMAALDDAAAYLERSLREAGYVVQSQEFQVRGETVRNLEVEIPGASRPGEIVVVGAHYDSVHGSPGANDNGTGVAAVLELARAFAGARPARTVRFVLFVNEEPPFFQSETMGSYVYARRCRERGENVVGMLSLETIGYYSDEEGSQNYPAPLGSFYPTRGNFLAFVANTKSKDLLFDTVRSFRTHARFPSEGGALSESLSGVGWSDHWSFWQFGFPGVEITDTAPFRYPYYHTSGDTPDKVDYERTARVVVGLEAVIRDLAGR
jgi:hypothetical protein